MGMNLQGEAKKKDESHKFWDTQPVPKLCKIFQSCAQKAAVYCCIILCLAAETGGNHGQQIDSVKTVEDIRQEPYQMPKGFEWCTLDIADPIQENFHMN